MPKIDRCKGSFRNGQDCELDHCHFDHHLPDYVGTCLPCEEERKSGRCDDCGDFHDKTISCEELSEIRHAENSAWDANP